MEDTHHTAWRRKWQPLQCSCLENPEDRGAWRATVQQVQESDTTERLNHPQQQRQHAESR